MTPETRAKARFALRHPVTWAKGADLPEETIRPWEHMFQFVAPMLTKFRGGFAGKQDLLYIGMAKGKIPPNWTSVTGTLNSVWDVVNDPLIGSYMDRHHFGARMYRWIMRATKLWSAFWGVFLLFNFGLSPMQRLVMWCVVGLAGDIFGTANTVADSKIWAGITPHTEQRSKIQLAKTLGDQTGQALSAVYLLFFGLKDVLGVTDYQILVLGALILTPVALLGDLLPTFARQRVNFERDPDQRLPTLRENFAIVRHNKMFVIRVICGFLTVFTPAIDGMFVYRFLLSDRMTFRGKPVGGEIIKLIAQSVVGTPGTFLQPFARQFIRKVGGERNMLMLNHGTGIVQSLLSLAAGYKTFPRLLNMLFWEMVKDIPNKFGPVADAVISYEMLDYVEWKTGERSEGVTMSVNALISKLVTSNIGMVTQNAFMQWSGYKGWDVPREEQPKRFLDMIFPMLFITQAVDHLIWLVGYCFYNYKKETREQVEAELIERRRLAQEKRAEMEARA
ncbi:MAG: MFS transporter [Oscillospiraceae bacterium]|nr:MFS transporter [Oscillospiraceae bacterium]